MKNLNNISKKIIFLIIASVLLISVYSFDFQFRKLAKSEILKELIEKFNSFNTTFPEERVYLQFDKTLYEPGETIWFSGYLVNADDFTKSDVSSIINVELINPQGTTVTTLKIISVEGKANGDFTLADDAIGGLYKVKAYTNWQLNEENPNVFEKEIQVQDYVMPNLKMSLDFLKDAYGASDKVSAELELVTNENAELANYQFSYVVNIDGTELLSEKSTTDNSGKAVIKFMLPDSLSTSDGLLNVMIDYQGNTESISRSIPIVLNNISMEFFPEGGDLIAGANSNVAFRALNEFGEGADIEGEIYNQKDEFICSFSSYHKGMGALNFTPKSQEKYYAKITKPQGITEKYELPEVLKTGFSMKIAQQTENYIVLNIFSYSNENVSIIAQTRGKIYSSDSYKVVTGNNIFAIPTQSFPGGVSQITLFDKAGIPQAERLTYVNKNKLMNVSIETDKEKYLPREKVTMKIKTTDESEENISANLSLAVVDDQLLSFADDKSGNILSQLLLEQDLNQEVEEAAFYFDKDEPKADSALNYLLMTAGWRRYTWKQVVENELPVITYQPERNDVEGRITNQTEDFYISKLYLKEDSLEIPIVNDNFLIKNLMPLKPKTLVIETNDGFKREKVISNYDNLVICPEVNDIQGVLFNQTDDFYISKLYYKETGEEIEITDNKFTIENFDFTKASYFYVIVETNDGFKREKYINTYYPRFNPEVNDIQGELINQTDDFYISKLYYKDTKEEIEIIDNKFTIENYDFTKTRYFYVIVETNDGFKREKYINTYNPIFQPEINDIQGELIYQTDDFYISKMYFKDTKVEIEIVNNKFTIENYDFTKSSYFYVIVETNDGFKREKYINTYYPKFYPEINDIQGELINQTDDFYISKLTMKETNEEIKIIDNKFTIENYDFTKSSYFYVIVETNDGFKREKYVNTYYPKFQPEVNDIQGELINQTDDFYISKIYMKDSKKEIIIIDNKFTLENIDFVKTPYIYVIVETNDGFKREKYINTYYPRFNPEVNDVKGELINQTEDFYISKLILKDTNEEIEIIDNKFTIENIDMLGYKTVIVETNDGFQRENYISGYYPKLYPMVNDVKGELINQTEDFYISKLILKDTNEEIKIFDNKFTIENIELTKFKTLIIETNDSYRIEKKITSYGNLIFQPEINDVKGELINQTDEFYISKLTLKDTNEEIKIVNNKFTIENIDMSSYKTVIVETNDGFKRENYISGYYPILYPMVNDVKGELINQTKDFYISKLILKDTNEEIEFVDNKFTIENVDLSKYKTLIVVTNDNVRREKYITNYDNLIIQPQINDIDGEIDLKNEDCSVTKMYVKETSEIIEIVDNKFTIENIDLLKNKTLVVQFSDKRQNEIILKNYDKLKISDIYSVSGNITGEDGMGIPGATILVKGYSNIGTISDLDGNYTLYNVPLDANYLVFSFVGLKTVEKEIISNQINAILEDDQSIIEEVVVTALGITRDKKSLGYSATTVNAEEFSTNKIEYSTLKNITIEKVEPKIINNNEVVVTALGIKRSTKAIGYGATTIQSKYYIAKEFATPIYYKNQKVTDRTDFRTTIFWKNNITTDENGEATVEFYNCDAISSFRAIAEGIGIDGLVGRGEKVFFTQLPFSIDIKLPVEAVSGDKIKLPITLVNNTDDYLIGNLLINEDESFIPLTEIQEIQYIAPDSFKIIYLEYIVPQEIGNYNFSFSLEADGLSDAFSKDLEVVSSGYPSQISISSQEIEKSYEVDIPKVVNGSLTAEFTAFPNVVSEMMQSVEGLINEPSGCFEQTSSKNYPNVMAMQYLKANDSEDEVLLSKLSGMLERGYKRLITFETSSLGFDWYGRSPGNEYLSAYAIMQFSDMKNYYDGVEEDLIKRTSDWLISKKTKNSGFIYQTIYSSYYSAYNNNLNAYICYALSEANYTSDIKNEIDLCYKNALESNDLYEIALSTLVLFNAKENTKAEKLLKFILEKQSDDGSWNGSKYSITYSTGISLKIETTSLCVLAILKSENPDNEVLSKAINYLIESRNGNNYFGSTQGTILALKALTQYTYYSKKTEESGTIQIFIDDELVAEQSYEKGHNEAIKIENLSEKFTQGKHIIKIMFKDTKTALPYSMAINYNTLIPNSSDECSVKLETKLDKTEAKVGETVRLSVKLENITSEGLPSTVAIIGIPAGLTAQPWQLKELQEKQIVDYYETIGNNFVIYFRDMAPNEICNVNLDLKAEIQGEFQAPASVAYLYYTNEYKSWSLPDLIKIEN